MTLSPVIRRVWFNFIEFIGRYIHVEQFTVDDVAGFHLKFKQEFYQLINTTFANHFWSAEPTLHFMKYQTFYYNNKK